MTSFPYQAWRITPSFFIEQVTLVSETRYGSHLSDKGKWYAPLGELFKDAETARAIALQRLEDRRAKAQKQLDSIPRLIENARAGQ
jgi:hypothetical protein